MRTKLKKTEKKSGFNPQVDDSVKPNFKVFWVNRKKATKGQSTFFTYEYGAEIIAAVFRVMYPGREILQIKELFDHKH